MNALRMKHLGLLSAFVAGCTPAEIQFARPDAQATPDRWSVIAVDASETDLPASLDAAMPPKDTVAVDAPIPREDRVAARDAPVLLDAPPGCGRELTPCCAGLSCLPGLRCAEARCVQDPTCGGLDRTCCRGTACDPGLRCEAGRCVGTACTPLGAPCGEGTTCCAGRACRPTPTNRLCCTEIEGPCTGPGECCGTAVCAAGRCTAAP